MPTMPPAAMLEVMRGKHVQFWGDSTSAQMECDLRGALDRVAAPPRSTTRADTGARSARATLAARSPRHTIASGARGTARATARKSSGRPRWSREAGAPRRVVFNLGEHYRKNHTERMPSAIRHFAAALAQLDATIVIRSSSVTRTDGDRRVLGPIGRNRPVRAAAPSRPPRGPGRTCTCGRCRPCSRTTAGPCSTWTYGRRATTTRSTPSTKAASRHRRLHTSARTCERGAARVEFRAVGSLAGSRP